MLCFGERQGSQGRAGCVEENKAVIVWMVREASKGMTQRHLRWPCLMENKQPNGEKGESFSYTASDWDVTTRLYRWHELLTEGRWQAEETEDKRVFREDAGRAQMPIVIVGMNKNSCIVLTSSHTWLSMDGHTQQSETYWPTSYNMCFVSGFSNYQFI